MTDASKKINVLYHLWHNDQPVPNGYKDIAEYHNYPNSYHFIDDMVYFDDLLLNFTEKISTSPDTSDPYFFIIHSHNWLQMKEVEPYVPPHVRQMLIEDNRFHLVIWEASELHEPNFSIHQDTRIETIRNFFKKLKIPKRKKHVVTCNTSIEGTYADRGTHLEWGFNVFKFWFGLAEQHLPMPTQVPEVRKHSLFLGGKARLHRMYFLYSMNEYRHNMEHSLHWLPQEIRHFNTSIFLKDNPCIEACDFVNWIKNTLPIKLDLKNDTMDTMEFRNANASQLCNAGYLHIVPESQFHRISGSDHMFVSEKSFKPMAMSQIGIWIGRPGLLKYLHELGYKTFPTVIDESYDKILDDKERMDHIILECKRLLSYDLSTIREKYRSVWQTIEHNQNMIQKLSTPSQLIFETKQLFQSIATNNAG
jgi:hypothetical protein